MSKEGGCSREGRAVTLVAENVRRVPSRALLYEVPSTEEPGTHQVQVATVQYKY